MGGNAFNTETFTAKRVNKQEYYEILEQLLDEICNIIQPNFRLYDVAFIKSKDSFGDMDVIIESTDNCNWFEIENIFKQKYKYQSNGNVFSILRNDFQIDFIKVPSISYDYAIHYFSWNDLGNIVGRLLKQYGFKHGWDGLFYPQRTDTNDNNVSDHVVKEHSLSYNYYDSLKILQLDIDKFKKGFNTYEEMFDWILASPLFIYEIFKFENLNHTNKVRDRKRKTYNMFLEYLEKKHKESPFSIFVKKTKEEKRAFVIKHFPNIEKEIELVDEQIKIHNVCKSKFNGNLVLKLTQRTGKQLGALMKILKSKLTDNVVYHMCVEEIENIILQEHYKLLKEERIQSEQENMRFIDE